MWKKINIISLFSWAWGLDLWFHNAGFSTVWANEYDSSIWETFEHNFKWIKLDRRSIVDVSSDEIPEALWIIWWPPCQSWSLAWSWKWINDKRWKLFHEYIRVLKDKKPLFFLAENVPWILVKKHSKAFNEILESFSSLWYKVTYFLLNANDYWVPQDRKRVIIVWYKDIIWKEFNPTGVENYKPVLKDAIWDLPAPIIAKEKNYTNYESDLEVFNHEYMHGSFSSMYMSRNRVRSWEEPSFTIQAWWRHAPIHPQAPKMKLIEKDKRIFIPWKEDKYRRLSVRECARIQTFPDDFKFIYHRISDGYKMIWNAVPSKFAESLAKVIYRDISDYLNKK